MLEMRANNSLPTILFFFIFQYWSDKKVSVKRSLETARVLGDRNSDLSTLSDVDHRVVAIIENPIFEVEHEFEEPESPSMVT